MWYNERINKRRVSVPPKFSICCMHGKIELPAPPMLPQALLDLLFGDDDLSKKFRENIGAYNSMFAFTSMGGKIDASINTGRGPNVFRLIGQNFHKIGSLLPPDGAPPKFQQLYIIVSTEFQHSGILLYLYYMVIFHFVNMILYALIYIY